MKNGPNRLKKLSILLTPGWMVLIVFGSFIGGAYLLGYFLPAPRDATQECRQQCIPRAGNLVDDKNYPMSAKGMYRKICECS